MMVVAKVSSVINFFILAAAVPGSIVSFIGDRTAASSSPVDDGSMGAARLPFNVVCCLYFSLCWLFGADTYTPSNLGSFNYLVLLAFLIMNAWSFVIGVDYLFVPHPAEHIVSTALDAREPLDAGALAGALTPDLSELDSPPPAYRSQNQAKKSRKLKERLEADGRLAEAAVYPERARAAAHPPQEIPEAEDMHLNNLRLTKGDRI